MGSSFTLGFLFTNKNRSQELLQSVVSCCRKFGFTNGEIKDEQLFVQSITNIPLYNEDSFFDLTNSERLEIQIGVSVRPESFGYPKDLKFGLVLVSTNRANIMQDSEVSNQKVLNNLTELAKMLHSSLKCIITWGGYVSSIPSAKNVLNNEIENLRWLNIFSAPFVKKFGQSKLLCAGLPVAVQLSDQSVICVLSLHPDVYTKVNNRFPHEVLGLEYIS